MPDEPPNQILKIRLERAQIVPAAFTVSALARRIGVSEASVRAWQSGRARPSHRHIRALARELGVKPEELGL